MARWLVSVSYEADTADDADNVRDVISGTLTGQSWQDFTVSDVVGVPAEDEPTTTEREH